MIKHCHKSIVEIKFYILQSHPLLENNFYIKINFIVNSINILHTVCVKSPLDINDLTLSVHCYT